MVKHVNPIAIVGLCSKAMSVELPIEASLRQAHAAAIDELNRWRGHCVESFARIEHAVHDCLAAMTSSSEAVMRIPTTFSARVKELSRLLSPGEAFSSPKLLKALDRLSVNLEQRNLIVHSTGTVWIASDGTWLWRLRFVSLGKATSESRHTIDSRQAAQLEKELSADARSFCDQVNNFTKTLAATE